MRLCAAWRMTHCYILCIGRELIKTKYIMKVQFDDTEFHLNETTVNALKIFMLLYLKNVRDSKQFDNECWTWGLAKVKDFCTTCPVNFVWGGEEDLPTRDFEEDEIYVHI